MNYDQRITHIKEWFKSDMLTRFTPPSGVDPKLVAIDSIEAVNANLPSKLTSETLSNLLSSMTKEIARAARSRTLPVVKDFIAAAHNASESHRAPRTDASDSPFTIDTFKITEARVRASQPIGDQFLRGTMREQLLARTSVTAEDLDKYIDRTAHKQ